MSCGCKKTVVSSAGGQCCDAGVLVLQTPVDAYPDPCGCQVCGSQSSCCCTSSSSSSTTDCSYPIFASLSASFNMPACGQEAQIQSPEACRIAPGTVLYSPSVGYLIVTARIDDTTLSVRNDCPEDGDGNDCNALAPGEPVPSSSIFALGIPFCGPGGGSGPQTSPYLAADFIIPNVSSCANAVVTNVVGLNIGDIVSIDGNEYRIGAIPNATALELCNDGDGGTPLSVIYWDPNGDGEPNWPVIRVGGQNPCTSTPVNILDRIVGCDGAGQTVGGVGQVNDQAFLWNNVTQQWELKVIDQTATCVTLACGCLNLDPEAPPTQEYIIQVSPNTEQIAAALAELDENPLCVTINDDPFCVTEVIDAENIKVIPNFEVVEVTSYPEGAIICICECCDQCRPTVEVSGPFNASPPDQAEVLITFDSGTLSLSAEGFEVNNLPATLASNADGSANSAAARLWLLQYQNGLGCACHKYAQVMSNFQVAISMPQEVSANIEFRMLHVLPVFDSQSFAAIPIFYSPAVPGLNSTPNLLLTESNDFKFLGTYKGMLYDRAFMQAGELHQWQGHIRIITYNSSASPEDIRVVGNWRVWLNVWNDQIIQLP